MAQLPEAGDDGFLGEDQGDELLQRITHDSREENSNSGKCLQLQWWEVSPVAIVEVSPVAIVESVPSGNSGRCLQLQWWKVSPVAIVESVSSCNGGKCLQWQ